MTPTPIFLVVLAALFAPAALAAEGPNPYTGRQQRAEVFQFDGKPAIAKQGDNYVVRFASKAACDATVAIVDKQGKVVRHLASGVLGKNAPAPFEQGSLEQELIWDGRDDQGKPIDVAECQVRVALGLKPRLDKLFGWTPGTVSVLKGIAVDRGGRLAVLDGRTAQGQGFGFTITPNVRLFDREGRYLRRLVPPNPMLPPERSGLVQFRQLTSGKVVPKFEEMGLQFSICEPPQMNMGTIRQQPVVTSDGRFLFLSSDHHHTLPRRLFIVDLRDGATDTKVIGAEKEDVTGGGYPFMALSPDEKWLYLCSFSPEDRSRKGEGSKHAVFRVPMQTDGLAEPFLGVYGEPGKDNRHFDRPLGVACDAAGNVYVADHGNDRVQVFSPEGKFLGSIETKAPELLDVSRKTGAIYVTSVLVPHMGRRPIIWDRRDKGSRMLGGNSTSSLVKFNSMKEPTRTVLVEEVVTGGANSGPLMALDETGGTPVVWFSAHFWDLQRFEDRGDEFVRTSSETVCGGAGDWRGWNSDSFTDRLMVDPQRGELYVHHARQGWFVVDSRTGEFQRYVGHAHGAPIGNPGEPPIGEMELGPDGMIYMRLWGLGIQLTRYDPDSREYVGFPESPHNTMLEHRGLTYPGIPIPNDQSARGWPDSMAVAPNGDFFIPNGRPTPQDVAELKKRGLDYPTAQNAMSPGGGNLLKVYAKDGSLKCFSALPGVQQCVGMRVGRSGAVYTVMPCRPIDKEEKLGTLVKFDSRFDQFPIGRIEGTWNEKLEEGGTHVWGSYSGNRNSPVRIENLAWDYHGVLARFSGCTCSRSQFSLDAYERVFLQMAPKCAVDVLDANGNVIVSMGGYGNADCRGPDSPVVDPKTGELRPRRPDDPPGLKSPLAEPEITFLMPNFTTVDDEALFVNDLGNERIVRVALQYETEETITLP
jgi:hypothetical protein